MGWQGHNWAGNITFSTTDVRRPTSIEELQQILADARLVRALGTGHSFSAIADTTGTLVSTASLLLDVEIDAERRVAVVPGGAKYAAVATALHAAGWALPNLGSLPHISVAGACATATHGSGNALGCLATAVVGLELVRADGELWQVHRGDPDFPGSVVSLGALGVVTRVWLAIQPTYEVSQTVLLDLPRATAVQDAADILDSATSVSIFSAFGDPGVVDAVWRKQRTDAPADERTFGGRVATEPVHPLRGLDAAAATQQLAGPGPWHERLPHFRLEFTPSAGEELQSEFFLDRRHAGAALEALSGAASRITPALQVFEMRTIAADDLWLSPFRERDTVAVHATWVSDIDVVRPCLAALEVLLEPFDPRAHWGKVSLGFDAERNAELYPLLPRFRELAERLDPERCFVNDFLTERGVR